MEATLPHHHPTLLHEAHALVTDPAAALRAGPLARRMAWAALLSARGVTMAQRRLPLPAPPPPAPGNAA